MHYKGEKANSYNEIRLRKDSQYKNPFSEHLAKGKANNIEAKTVAFVSIRSATILIIPTNGYTTIYDFGGRGGEEEIRSFWKMNLAIWKKYENLIQASRFNTGNTYKYAAQSTPHVHVRCELTKLPKGMGPRSFVAWHKDANQVTFGDPAPEISTSAKDYDPYKEGISTGPSSWQKAELVIVGLFVMLVLGWTYANKKREEPSQKSSKKLSKK